MTRPASTLMSLLGLGFSACASVPSTPPPKAAAVIVRAYASTGGPAPLVSCRTIYGDGVVEFEYLGGTVERGRLSPRDLAHLRAEMESEAFRSLARGIAEKEYRRRYFDYAEITIEIPGIEATVPSEMVPSEAFPFLRVLDEAVVQAIGLRYNWSLLQQMAR